MPVKNATTSHTNIYFLALPIGGDKFPPDTPIKLLRALADVGKVVVVGGVWGG